jgi:mono/diheme cytochrome c family protein
VNQDKSKSDFPMNFIVNLMPEKAALIPIPDTNDILKYGKYMAVISGCQICHTKEEQGKAVGQPAGGNEYKMPDGSKVYSVNITPDKETGIGNWSKEEFGTI